MFQKSSLLSLFGFILCAVVCPVASAEQSRLVDMLYCRVTSAMQTLDVEAEVNGDNLLTNLRVWTYGHGSSSLIEKIDSVVGVEVPEVLEIFKSYRPAANYDISGTVMKGPALVFKLDRSGDSQFVLNTRYANGQNSEARLIMAGRDSPVQFHSFQCRVSPSYTR